MTHQVDIKKTSDIKGNCVVAMSHLHLDQKVGTHCKGYGQRPTPANRGPTSIGRWLAWCVIAFTVPKGIYIRLKFLHSKLMPIFSPSSFFFVVVRLGPIWLSTCAQKTLNFHMFSCLETTSAFKPLPL